MTELTDTQIARLIGTTHSTDVPTRYIRLMAAEIAHRRNMEKDMEQRPSFGSSHIDQPRHSEDMSAREIEEQRIRILESAKFAESLETCLENREEHDSEASTFTFTRSEIGILGYYLGLGDKEALYRFLKELMGKDIENIVRKMEET